MSGLPWHWPEVTDSRVLRAMERVDRALFVPEGLKHLAYADEALPLAEGQTISQPFIVAVMTQSLALPKEAKVLEIGTGSGYQTAILAEICKEVYTVEIRASLAEKARQKLTELGYENIHFRTGDGFEGWPEAAPFHGILVACAMPFVPNNLLNQLADGGRMVVPVDQPTRYQELYVIERKGEKFDYHKRLPCAFVPMTGRIRSADREAR